MAELTDHELLTRFAHTGEEAAFATLVQRHVNLVWSAARRFTGDDTLASEVTQAVFIILAQKAGRLSAQTVVTGWLYQTARLTAANALKENRRRQQREHQAYMESKFYEDDLSRHSGATAEAWQQLAPVLDEAMHALRTADRDAVLLRFFENKSLADVGAALGVTEDAARVRVNRALDKLRALLAKQGITFGAALLATAVVENSVQAAPIELATKTATIAVKGLATTKSITALTKGALKIMAWTKVKATVAVAVGVFCILGAGAGYYEYKSAHRNAAKDLQLALNIKRPLTGTWSYPSEKVQRSLFDFGTNRADAFAILTETIKRSNLEARKQAVSALSFVGRTFQPGYEKYGLVGEPSPKVVPLLWQILNSNDGELDSFALTSLRGIGFQPENLPVLAALLVKSHHGQLSQNLGSIGSVKQMQKMLDRMNDDEQMQRYLPEAIAETIRKYPEATASFIEPVEDLLDDQNFDIRFGAACALAESEGVGGPRISAAFKDALRASRNNFRYCVRASGHSVSLRNFPL